MVDYRQWAYRELKRQGFTVFAPYKSMSQSSDCVVTSDDCQSHLQRIRIKGSQSSYKGKHPTTKHPTTWYAFSEGNLRDSIGVIDFWVFVSSRRVPKSVRCEPIYLVIPTSDLISRLGQYAIPDTNDTYHLYLQWDEPDHKGMVIESRVKEPWPIKPGSPRDYSCYAENWTLIKEKTSS